MSAQVMAEEEILTTGEVAEMLRCTPKTVRLMVRDGQLDGFFVRTDYRIYRSSVEKLMNTPASKPKKRPPRKK